MSHASVENAPDGVTEMGKNISPELNEFHVLVVSKSLLLALLIRLPVRSARVERVAKFIYQ